MTKGMVVVGSLNMDLVVNTSRHPRPGETILGGVFQTFPGGKGANQAVAASRLGEEVWMVGCTGQDDFGKELIDNLKQDKVHTEFVFQKPQTRTGVALITVEEGGQNTIVVAPGANSLLRPEDVLAAEKVFQKAAVVLLQLEIPLDTVRAAVDLARRHGAEVILNPAPAQKLSPELLSKIDTLIPNETEIQLLFDDVQDLTPEQASGKLEAIGVKNVLVTLGSAGVFVSNPAEQFNLPAFPVEVVDTTAAGDAFVAGFAVARLRGASLREAAQYGSAAGAIAVTRSGAQPSLPTQEEVEALIHSAQEQSSRKELR